MCAGFIVVVCSCRSSDPTGFVVALLPNMEEEPVNVDLPSDDDLTSCCSPEWNSDEEAARMDILLLQANWGKKQKRMRKVLMTAKAKRKRFAKMLRKGRPTLQDEVRRSPTQSPGAMEYVGAPNVDTSVLT